MRHFFDAAAMAAAVSLGFAALSAAAEIADEPTAQETLCLEFINRCRADPVTDSVRIVPKRARSSKFDVAMFHREMAKTVPAPPLVFDLKLNRAARLHSRYQIVHGQTHAQTPGRVGFMGVQSWDRMKAMGFSGHAYGENVFLRSDGPWHSHWKFVVDTGKGGPGGMQPGRGHRANILNANYNAIGIGAIEHDDRKLAVTHNFAADRRRRLGGVVYADRNQNRFYDIGEGVDAFEIAAGDSVVRSWLSGAYALEIDDETDRVMIELDGRRYVRRFGGGKQNVKIDVVVTDRAALARAESLIRKLPAAGGNAAKEKLRNKRLMGLLYLANEHFVSESALEKIGELTSDLVAEIDQVKNEVRSAVELGDTRSARTEIAKHTRQYNGTPVADWLNEARACVAVNDTYRKLAAAVDAGARVNQGAIGRNLQTLAIVESKCTSSDWKAFLRDVRTKYHTILARSAEPP